MSPGGDDHRTDAAVAMVETDAGPIGALVNVAGWERFVESLTKAIPMHRLATPADVAPAIVFLASDDAAYITGQTLSVSGGLTMA